MGYFKVKSKVKLSELEVGTRLEESDFATMCEDGTFAQLEYIDEDNALPETEVNPGVWAIRKEFNSLKLYPVQFVDDNILESFVHTKHISDKIDHFFGKLDVYKELGIEVPKRGMLLYGPAGSGKTSTISKVIRQYGNDNKTAVLIWNTDKFESYMVKDFIKSFKYTNGTERFVLVAEDIGGVEVSEAHRASDSSLLSLLDNQEKTFSLPTLIIATTNFPETFMGNLTNRPQRFDDKIEVGFPDGKSRQELLKFYDRFNQMDEVIRELIGSQKCQEFTPAHIKEVVIRTAIYEKKMLDVIHEMTKEIENYKKAFSNKGKMGLL